MDQAFEGKSDWTALDAAFPDDAPDGWATALCFFSPEAFRFYLPAYLIADVDGLLERVEPAFHLTYGFQSNLRTQRIGALPAEVTLFEQRRSRFSLFTRDEAVAVLGYFSWKRKTNEFMADDIERALANYRVARTQARPA